jgi:hypothetical protein
MRAPGAVPAHAGALRRVGAGALAPPLPAITRGLPAPPPTAPPTPGADAPKPGAGACRLPPGYKPLARRRVSASCVHRIALPPGCGGGRYHLIMGAFPPSPRSPAVPHGQACIGHQEVFTAGGSKTGARLAPLSRGAPVVVCEGTAPEPQFPARQSLVTRGPCGSR